MYREKIDKFIDAHKTEMLEDIAELCKIDSTKDSYRAGRPYGAGCFEALGAALHIAWHMKYIPAYNRQRMSYGDRLQCMFCIIFRPHALHKSPSADQFKSCQISKERIHFILPQSFP